MFENLAPEIIRLIASFVKKDRPEIPYRIIVTGKSSGGEQSPYYVHNLQNFDEPINGKATIHGLLVQESEMVNTLVNKRVIANCKPLDSADIRYVSPGGYYPNAVDGSWEEDWSYSPGIGEHPLYFHLATNPQHEAMVVLSHLELEHHRPGLNYRLYANRANDHQLSVSRTLTVKAYDGPCYLLPWHLLAVNGRDKFEDTTWSLTIAPIHAIASIVHDEIQSALPYDVEIELQTVLEKIYTRIDSYQA